MKVNAITFDSSNVVHKCLLVAELLTCHMKLVGDSCSVFRGWLSPHWLQVFQSRRVALT